MVNNWTAKTLGQLPGAGESGDDEDMLVLVQGKNAFNDSIYCYIKVSSSRMNEFMNVLKTTRQFDLREYGTVVAAGRGVPTADTQIEVTQDLGIKPGDNS